MRKALLFSSLRKVRAPCGGRRSLHIELTSSIAEQNDALIGYSAYSGLGFLLLWTAGARPRHAITRTHHGRGHLPTGSWIASLQPSFRSDYSVKCKLSVLIELQQLQLESGVDSEKIFRGVRLSVTPFSPCFVALNVFKKSSKKNSWVWKRSDGQTLYAQFTSKRTPRKFSSETTPVLLLKFLSSFAV